MPLIEELRNRISPDVKEGEPLARHTTFKIGGPAEFFFEAKSADAAVKASAAAKELGLALSVFGGGSNMLVSDEGIKGLVVKMANREFAIEGNEVRAEAGAPTGLVSTRSVDAGLTGFEWAVGVPGTIGGAVRGNAGSGGEMKDVVTGVRALKDGAEKVLSNAECGFAYRDSVFKREPGWIVLSATLKLAPSPDKEKAKELLLKLLLDRKEKQPIEYPCAGCIFTNWKPGSPEDLESLRKSLDLDSDEKIPLTALGTVPAGWIIDRAQLKGMKVGHAMVSEKHGNFFIHDGKGKADDIIALIAAVKTRVRNMTHGVVQLVEEVEYVGF
jgi:UDP-N-acetylmuramate dehydrogenase